MNELTIVLIVVIVSNLLVIAVVVVGLLMITNRFSKKSFTEAKVLAKKNAESTKEDSLVITHGMQNILKQVKEENIKIPKQTNEIRGERS